MTGVKIKPNSVHFPEDSCVADRENNLSKWRKTGGSGGRSPRNGGLSEVKGNSIEYLTESSLGGKLRTESNNMEAGRHL